MRKMNTKSETRTKLSLHRDSVVAVIFLLSLTLLSPVAAFAGKKKDNALKKIPVIDYSNIVWPNPPAIARIRYQAFYSAQKLSQVDTPNTKKQKWMDRLAGTQAASAFCSFNFAILSAVVCASLAVAPPKRFSTSIWMSGFFFITSRNPASRSVVLADPSM